jgi:hypothetical protein
MIEQTLVAMDIDVLPDTDVVPGVAIRSSPAQKED